MNQILKEVITVFRTSTIITISVMIMHYLGSDTEKSFEDFKQEENYHYLILEKCKTPKDYTFGRVLVLNLNTLIRGEDYLKYDRMSGFEDFYDYLQVGDTIFKELKSTKVMVKRNKSFKHFQGYPIKNYFEINEPYYLFIWIVSSIIGLVNKFF